MPEADTKLILTVSSCTWELDEHGGKTGGPDWVIEHYSYPDDDDDPKQRHEYAEDAMARHKQAIAEKRGGGSKHVVDEVRVSAYVHNRYELK